MRYVNILLSLQEADNGDRRYYGGTFTLSSPIGNVEHYFTGSDRNLYTPTEQVMDKLKEDFAVEFFSEESEDSYDNERLIYNLIERQSTLESTDFKCW